MPNKMDEFAQTRSPDDLFDDEFTPVAETIPETIQHSDPQPQHAAYNAYAPRGRGQGRGQPSYREVTHQSARQEPTSHKSVSQPTNEATTQGTSSADPSAVTPGETDPASTAQQPPQQPRPPTAVRGDRTATGGITKPKLTEEELSERMAAVKLNNAKRAEAHRLAEADEASFQQREERASQKRKEEGAARRVMNMEREKNRVRKLGAQAGREWDEGKAEENFSQQRGSQFKRGAHGAVGSRGRFPRGRYGDGASEQELDEKGGGHPREIRSRGGRGRGGRGRGGFAPQKNIEQCVPDPQKDFPALPMTSKPTTSAAMAPDKVGSWADEVQEARGPAEGS